MADPLDPAVRYALPADDGDSATWGDYGRAIGLGVGQVGSAVSALGREYNEGADDPGSQYRASLFKYWQDSFRSGSENLERGMTPQARARLESSVASPEFWDHFVSASVLKTLNMTPMMAASIVPGGMFADGAAALGATALAGGALNAGMVTDDIYKKLDSLPDDKLQDTNPYYAGLRSMGIDEQHARIDLSQKLMGIKPLVNFALGAAATAIGPAGKIAEAAGSRAAGEVVENAPGLVTRAGKGALEGAGGMAVQNAGSDISGQLANEDLGTQKEFNGEELVSAILDGSFFGGVMGGAGGALARRGVRPSRVPETSTEDVPATGPDAAQAKALNEQQSQSEPQPNQSPDQVSEQTAPESTAPESTAPESTAPKPAVEPPATGQAQPPVPKTPGQQAADLVADINQAKAEKGAPAAQAEAQQAPNVDTASGDTAQENAPDGAPNGPPVVTPPDQARQLAAEINKAKQEKAQSKEEQIANAADRTQQEPPTPEQAENGDYQKGVAEIHGLPLVLETPKGGTRRAKDGSWEVNNFPAHYGYIAGSKGRDGEGVDVYVGDKPQSKWVYVIDQIDPETGDFDEHKAMVGFGSRVDALKAYYGAFDDGSGPSRIGRITAVTSDKFTDWVKNGDTTKPFHPELEKSSTVKAARLKVKEAEKAKAAEAKKAELAALKTNEDTKPAPKPAPAPKPRALQPEGKHLTVAEKEKRESDAQAAKDIFDEHVPGEIPNRLPSTKQEKAQLLARLDAMLEAAKERGVTIPQKVGYEGTPDHIVYLRDAADLAKSLRAGTARPAHIKTFLTDERLAKAGDFESLRARRRAEGEAASRRQQGDVETMGDEGVAQHADEANAHTQTPEDLVARMQEGGDRVVDEPTHVEPTPEEEAARRAELERKGAGGAQAPESAAGKGKITVIKKSKGRFSRVRLGRSVTQAGNDGRVLPADVGTDEDLIHEGTVSGIAKRADWGGARLGENTRGMNQGIGQILLRRMVNKVGNVKVRVISREAMDRLASRIDPSGGRKYDGAYDEGNDVIYLSADRALRPDGRVDARLLLHETIHAAFASAIQHDARFNNLLTRMLAHVKDNVLDQGHYGLKDIHEFVSEAMSNPTFQAELAHIDAPDWLVRELNMTGDKPTIWKAFVDLARKYALGIKERFGLGTAGHSMLEAVMHVGNRLDEYTNVRDELFPRGRGSSEGVSIRGGRAFSPEVTDRVTDMVKQRGADLGTYLKSGVRHVADKLSTNHMLAQRAAQFFKGSDAPRRIAEGREMMRVEKNKILDAEGGGHEIVRRGVDLQRKYKGTGLFEKASELGYDATINNVNLGPNADNAHLGKDATAGWQAKARLPALQERYNALPKDLQQWLQDAAKHFRDTQNRISMDLIKNILEAAGINEDGLAERIHKQGLNTSDRAKFETNAIVNALDDARELKQIKGMYFPLRRHGDVVVTGSHDLEVPSNATKVGDDTLQFYVAGNEAASRRAAREYVEKADLRHADTQRVFVDKNDPTKIVDSSDINAAPAFRVRMQTQHTEFHASEADAYRHAAELREQGLKNVYVEPKRLNPNAVRGDLMGSQFETIMSNLEKRANYTRLSPQQKNELIQAMREASIRLKAGTRVQSQLLPRRNVAGYDADLLHNSAQYANMAAGYQAKLRHMPRIEKALEEMREFMKNNRNGNDEETFRRGEIYREFENRVYGTEGNLPDQDHPVQRAVRRLMQVSMLDKLAGPSFHIINAMEPTTTSLPVIGARHGFLAAARAMANAYRLIGAGDAVLNGLRDTKRAFSKDTGFTNYIDEFSKEIAAAKGLSTDQKQRYIQALQHMYERGLIDTESGFEVARQARPSDSLAGRGLDRADLMARQMGMAIESINRAVTGLAAYDLEYKRTGDHAKAMQYAHDVTLDTMGNYSRTNSAPWFNHPVARISLQFKKFGQKTYYLWGKSIRGALAGDPEMARQLAGLMFTHAMVAGLLGLPLEPIRVGMIAANALGATPYTYNDFEQLVRQTLAGLVGKKAGEVIARGVPRLAGIETSSRFGLDSLLTFGQPFSQKQNDIKGWLFDTLAGAPAAYVWDQVRSAQALSKGDLEQAIQLTVPIKAVTDLMKAEQGLTQGGVDSKGRPTWSPYNAYEAGIQALGFTPSRKAEQQEFRSAVAGDTKQQSAERNDWINQWREAGPYERAVLWGKIEKWNAERPRDARLTRAQLQNAVQRKPKTGALGIPLTKQSKHLYQQDDIYNR